jgi:hypothetical protein
MLMYTVTIQLVRRCVRCVQSDALSVEACTTGQPRCFAFWQEFSKVRQSSYIHVLLAECGVVKTVLRERGQAE